MKRASWAMFFALLILAACQCKKDDRKIDESYNPEILPANFTNSTSLNNVYFRFDPGTKYIFDGEEHIEVQRSTTTKTVLGIAMVVINDKVWEDGKLVEDTDDWYAQDNDGNVWYFGEEVDNYDANGNLADHDGSWEAGVDGAKAGIVMLADPNVGDAYRQEYYFSEAEDEAEVIETGLTVTVPFGTFENCIKTKDFTELEPDVLEYKIYAPGIGVIQEIDAKSGDVKASLSAIERTPDASYNPSVSSGNFSNPSNLTNQYFPFESGKTYVFESPDGSEHIEVARTATTKMILGIPAIVVVDKVWEDDVLVEDTDDWFAQDNSGNVWYFGEDVDNYNEDGTFKDHHGSWEAGVDGAKPGIVMLANPQRGNAYRQEYYFGEAEDEAVVVETGLTVTVPYGTFTNVLKTKDFTSLETGVLEYKYYAPGIGLIKEEDAFTGETKVELVEIKD